MKKMIYHLIILLIAASSCRSTDPNTVYKSETLTVIQLTDKIYQHISYLQTKDFGKVACNGMIVVDEGEVLVIDTPAEDAVAKELLGWIEGELRSKVIGVIPSHFHVDCLGSLDIFHKQGIPSYANDRTIELAAEKGDPIPQQGFESSKEIKVGKIKAFNEFLGEGHTIDNIVTYVPSEKVLFGGCLIKRLAAGKGNLEDANIKAWPETVERVKAKYGEAKIIVPGHGNPGGIELLDFTIALFSKK